MDFSNIVKGQVAQSLVKTIFETGGYRVSRLGVEEVFKEVTHLEYRQYQALKLPLALRTLPDFLVATPDIDKAWLLEVKFRSNFDNDTITELHETLSKQFNYWDDAVAVILIGTHPCEEKSGKFIQDYMRVITKDSLNELIKPRDIHRAPSYLLSKGYILYENYWVWDSLKQPHHFFSGLHAEKVLKKADTMIKTLKSLVNN
ncbi:hypothetical protein CYQ88_08380 [Hydrogenovibrio sp. SC-1]|uniref:hypothetical protein n=1 Tax=Hydrogenovibrio sp. SC-1 TaxID=2065820 RepID=UPI000C7AD0D6|nr:hypothetical protein [Hydrogenovibrio sp. SC-1]PLA73971.1 hypothetical protein CYQ88_08380 [Hydrogenovibrio sp. SC-1]